MKNSINKYFGLALLFISASCAYDKLVDFKTEKPTGIAPLQKSVEKWIKTHYPMAVISFSPPETVFEKLFVTGEADIVAELHTRNKSEAPEASVLNKIEQQIEAKTGHTPVGITFDNQLNITIDRQKLLLYNVDYNEVYRLLKTAFKETMCCFGSV